MGRHLCRVLYVQQGAKFLVTQQQDILLIRSDAACDCLQDCLFHDRRHHQDIHLPLPPPYDRSHVEVSSHRQRHLSLPAHKLHFTRTILVLLSMLASSSYVGQNILWQTCATCQVLVNIGGREHTKRHSRCHGLRPAPYTYLRALEGTTEQENKDQIVHCVLDGLAILCGQCPSRACTKEYKQRHYL